MSDGSLLPIADFDSLYVLLGTAYGGDGQTTFGLRGRALIYQGNGFGLRQPGGVASEFGGWSWAERWAGL